VNALWYLAGVAAAWALILAYRLGRVSGVRRGRDAIVVFFKRTSSVLRAGEPGPMPSILIDASQASSLAHFLDDEGDGSWLRARFERVV
jgi:hypothetical protein